MSITDALREWIDSITWLDDSVSQAHNKVLSIADRIDVEYAAYRAAVDGMLKEYVKPPVDADGVPIHVGDVVEGEKIGGGFGEPFEVVGYIMSNGELEPMDEHKCPRKSRYLRHHQPDSWEGIIADALKFAGNGGVPAGARFADYAGEFVERCKKLAGEDE